MMLADKSLYIGEVASVTEHVKKTRWDDVVDVQAWHCDMPLSTKCKRAVTTTPNKVPYFFINPTLVSYFCWNRLYNIGLQCSLYNYRFYIRNHTE